MCQNRLLNTDDVHLQRGASASQQRQQPSLEQRILPREPCGVHRCRVLAARRRALLALEKWQQLFGGGVGCVGATLTAAEDSMGRCRGCSSPHRRYSKSLECLTFCRSPVSSCPNEKASRKNSLSASMAVSSTSCKSMLLVRDADTIRDGWPPTAGA